MSGKYSIFETTLEEETENDVVANEEQIFENMVRVFKYQNL
jgi:hypothetical protein